MVVVMISLCTQCTCEVRGDRKLLMLKLLLLLLLLLLLIFMKKMAQGTGKTDIRSP